MPLRKRLPTPWEFRMSTRNRRRNVYHWGIINSQGVCKRWSIQLYGSRMGRVAKEIHLDHIWTSTHLKTAKVAPIDRTVLRLLGSEVVAEQSPLMWPSSEESLTFPRNAFRVPRRARGTFEERNTKNHVRRSQWRSEGIQLSISTALTTRRRWEHTMTIQSLKFLS